MKKEFLDLHLTKDNIGCIVHIYDSRKGVSDSGLYLITGINGSVHKEPITTSKYTPDGVLTKVGYRLQVDGQWCDRPGNPVLGITELYTKEDNPEYFL